MVTAAVITKYEGNRFSVIHYWNSSCELSLGSSRLGQVPRVALFPLTLTIMGLVARNCVECPSICIWCTELKGHSHCVLLKWKISTWFITALNPSAKGMYTKLMSLFLIKKMKTVNVASRYSKVRYLQTWTWQIKSMGFQLQQLHTLIQIMIIYLSQWYFLLSFKWINQCTIYLKISMQWLQWNAY